MPFRVTDASSSARLLAQITASRQRIARAQEQVASGKRINRPSDNPQGAAAVVRVRTTQASLKQFEHNADTAHDLLMASDSALDAYEQTLDHARALLTRGTLQVMEPNGKPAIADELDSLHAQILTLANQRFGDQYLFGGTHQEVAPYDANGMLNGPPGTQQLIQIDPDGAPLAVGVTAEMAFADANGDVFAELKKAATALRGTGDAAADRAALLQSMDRLTALSDQAHLARAKVGVGLERAEAAKDQLGQRTLALEETANRTEGADLAEAALALSESQRTLEAILQTKAVTNGRSLMDLIG
jgi:flagellar hook-associated protein 3 FlgL